MIKIPEEKEKWLAIAEGAGTQVREIIKTCIINGFPKAWAKLEVLKLINETTLKFKNAKAPQELIDKTIKAIKYRFIGWYQIATGTIKTEAFKTKNSWLSKTYTSITGNQLKETKGFTIANDGYEEGSVENPREFVTTQARSGGQAYINDYMATVKRTMSQIAKERFVIKGKAGYSLSIRNLAEMSARFEAQRDELTKLEDSGVKFAYASTHVNASARCAIWQGKLFKLDVAPDAKFKQNVDLNYKPEPIGEIDGIKYYSLKEAMEHGFLGYNCRHRLVKYTKGMDRFTGYPKGQIEHERKLEQTQRKLERDVVHAKQALAMAVTKEEAKELRSKVYNLRETYYNYCKDNGLTISKMRIAIDTKPDVPYPTIENPIPKVAMETPKVEILKIEPVSNDLVNLEEIKKVYVGNDKLIDNAFKNANLDTESYKIISNLNKFEKVELKRTSKPYFEAGNNILAVSNSKNLLAFYHEFGHSLDRNTAFYKDYSTKGANYEWISEEFNTTREEVSKSWDLTIPQNAIDIFKSENDKLVDNIKKEYIESGQLKKDLLKEYTKKYGKATGSGLEAYILKDIEANLIQKKVKAFAEEDPDYNAWSYVSDIYDAITSGRAKNARELSGHHGYIYYASGSMLRLNKTGKTSKQNTEIFANYIALRLAGQQKQLDFLKEQIPTLYGKLEKAFTNMANILGGNDNE